MKRKLVLVNPVNPIRTGLTVNKSSRFPPLGLGIVAALTPADWEIELIDENWQPFRYQQADLVGITAFTAAANRAYEIAAIYRRQGVPVVMGGIHASMCTEEALRYVDTVVVGEAEAIWPQVIADFEAGQLERVYQGQWGSLAGQPMPRRDLFHPDYMFASVQTSRGCPMDCDFCSVTAFNGRRYRRRLAEEVLAELEQIPQKFIFMVDDNIIGYGSRSREQSLELFKGMVARKLHKWWFCQASLNFADDEEVLYWAAKAGCKMVFLGLEAEDVAVLDEVNKRLNLKMGIDAYAGAFQRIHRAGISVLGAFIFGMDEDTPARLWRRTNYMIQSDIDVMQATLLTPLPGTRLFERFKAQGRLWYTNFPQDWDRFDMGEVVYQPKNIGLTQLAEIAGACRKRMYAWPVLLRKAFRTGWQTRDMMTTMFAWQSNINYRNVSLGE
ncbi:MAG: B12-binding domain-containing radical SAM protein [Anaerolineales bacterium]|nr:B12-binding domain-containing radical SAM protein [Anaerolineales bacterium]